MKFKWILASASPRRRELLKKIIPEYEIMISDCEESYISTTPEDIVEELAELKGKAVASYFLDYDEDNDQKVIIVSADTVVSIDGQILGKPHSKDEAEKMLRMLSGKNHQVFTGVCVIRCIYGEIAECSVFHEATDIYVDELTDKEIEEYISTDEPYDKAGGYAIQGGFAKHISAISGDYSNVVGFPLHSFYKYIKERGYLD